ncbi:hypothetical protein F5X68DRAFT_260444 [Plectosphaerella plurivora]|uniref:Uncharacterized protein n=1 Tax=Plectosphaerella plurivora TaxID=936078 RepID=A0A9P8VGH3_9PEZI|nr:hypothetical protein F5X68DRAFT_260444 [Plectosphaerella plurivora]
MVGIAILGAGIFAREQHIPAIEAVANLDLKAIYSRSLSSAESLAGATTSSTKPDLYHETPADDSKSLDALLARDDISAVIVCLPILAQPEIIKKALTAGKHVLSEKPIAKDIATAEALLAWYDALPSEGRPVWAIAENYRFMPSMVFAAEKAREIGGSPVTFSLSVFSLVPDDSKYYATPWRKTPEYQGGFLLDGGVHFVAALRLLLGAVGDDVHSLVARSSLLQKKLPPVDTLHAVLTTKGSVHGTASISFGTEWKSGFEAQLVTTEGAVTLEPKRVEWRGRGGERQVREFEWDAGVKAEVQSFVDSLEGGVVDERQSGQAALADLKIIEGMLQSGEKGGEARVL